VFVRGAYWWSNLRRQVFALTALALVVVVPGAARAYTNTTSGIVNLNGAVALVCSISINSSGATTTFSNMAQGTAATLIGTVVEICNDVNGYKVTLTTANNANFKGATTNALIPYSLTYNGGSVTFSSGTAILTPGGSRTTPLGVSKALNLTFGSGFYSSDSYDETLTITMIGQ
jgi:hypothetical protein